MKIISIIHTYLQSVDLNSVLTSLKSQQLSNFSHEIIVMENGLEQSQKDKYQQTFPDINFITSPVFMGIPMGLNLAVKTALQQNPDYLWITDPFVQPFPDMISQLVVAAESYKDCLLFTPKIYLDNNNNVLHSAGYTTDWTSLKAIPRGNLESDQPIFDRDIEVDYIPLSQLFIKTKTWAEVGLFDTRFFKCFFDFVFFQKIRNKGFKINYISLAKAHLLQGEISFPSLAHTYYSLRDQIYFSLAYAPISAKINALKLSYEKYFHGEPWEKRAVLDVFTANLGSASYQW